MNVLSIFNRLSIKGTCGAMKWRCPVDPRIYQFGFKKKSLSYKDLGNTKNIGGNRNCEHKQDHPESPCKANRAGTRE